MYKQFIFVTRIILLAIASFAGDAFSSFTNAISDTMNITYGDFVEGSIGSLGEIDTYGFTGTVGEHVIIRMDPEGIDTKFRGMIELYDHSGTLLVSAVDNWTNPGYPYNYGGRQVNFVDFELPATGQYTLYVREDNGDVPSNYSLSLHSREHLRDNAVSIAFDTTLTSATSPFGDIDAYRFAGQSGERVILRVDPDGIDTGFRAMIELYGPSDTLLVSTYDSWTNPGYPYNYGGRQVAIMGFILPEAGQYTLYVREDDGDHTSNYWLKLQTPHLLTLEQPAENQKLAANGDDKWYQVISHSLQPIVVQINKVSNWNATLRLKKSVLPIEQPYWSDAGNSNLELATIAAQADTYYVHVESNSNGGQYSILATTDFTKVNKTLAIDNDVVNAQISIQRATVTSFLFKKGSNTDLIASQFGSYLIDIGSDPRLGKYLNTGWSVQSAEVQSNYVSLSLSHPSGFANKLVFSWTNDRVEVRCDITAPEQVESHTVLRPGGGWESGRDKWAFPASAGLQTGSFSYPGNYKPLYPGDNSWGTPSEGWLALWDDQVNEVIGFTFSGGFKAKIGNGAGADIQFLFPVGTSRLAFQVSKPKTVTPYEVIRNLASGPFLTLNNQVDKIFVAAGNELTYSLIYSNTGNKDATSVVIENIVPIELELVDGSISNGGSYDAATRRIKWSFGNLTANADADTVTFKAKVTQGTTNGMRINNTARIWAVEQQVATTAFVISTVAMPFITSITPDKGGNAGTVTIEILGQNLDPKAEVKLIKESEKDITARSVMGISDGTRVEATFGLKGSSPGIWNLRLTNPSGDSTDMSVAFEIVEGGKAKLQIDLLAPATVRAGRQTTFDAIIRNVGLVDINSVFLWGVMISQSGELMLPPILPAMELGPLPPFVGRPIQVPIMIPEVICQNLMFEGVGESDEEPEDECEQYDCEELQRKRLKYLRLLAETEKAIAEIIRKLAELGCDSPSNPDILLKCEELKDELAKNIYWQGVWTRLLAEIDELIAICCTDAPSIDMKRVEQLPNTLHFADASTTICGVAPRDPNFKSSPAGWGDSLYVRSNLDFPYTVYFENLPSAQVAAQEVLITDQLDSTLNWSTFSLGEIRIGEKIVSVPRGTQSFKTTTDLRPSLSTVAEVDFKFNSTTGRAEWFFRGKDPYTGQLADLLPPNENEVAPRGEGWASYSVKPKQNLRTGTVIKNKAIIDFEVNIPPAPMETPEIFNTIDADAPDSHVLVLAATQDSAHFRVRWTGTDVGAAIRDFTIFVSEESGPYTAWIINTSDTSAVFTGQPNKTYAFYSVARDNVGNVEDTPNEPDAKTKAGQVTSVSGPDDNLPKTFSLSQNYPNPFNPSTNIRIEVPKASHLTIKIYDILGRAVRTLVDRQFEAGRYVEVWDGRDNKGLPVGSGIYFMRMQADRFVRVKKLMLIR